MIQIGDECEIRPGYNMETGVRDSFDEYAGCACHVLKLPGGSEALVYVKALGEVWIPLRRLRRRGGDA